MCSHHSISLIVHGSSWQRFTGLAGIVRRGAIGQTEEILRRALTAEPYGENICLELLRSYMEQGRRSKAVKLYYSFKKRLEQELDIKVDKSLTEAIRNQA